MSQLEILTALKSSLVPLSALELSAKTGIERHRILRGLRRLVKFKAVVPLFISYRKTTFKIKRGL